MVVPAKSENGATILSDVSSSFFCHQLFSFRMVLLLGDEHFLSLMDVHAWLHGATIETAALQVEFLGIMIDEVPGLFHVLFCDDFCTNFACKVNTKTRLSE